MSKIQAKVEIKAEESALEARKHQLQRQVNSLENEATELTDLLKSKRNELSEVEAKVTRDLEALFSERQKVRVLNEDLGRRQKEVDTRLELAVQKERIANETVVKAESAIRRGESDLEKNKEDHARRERELERQRNLLRDEKAAFDSKKAVLVGRLRAMLTELENA